ncbi:MAG: hypothetical protein KF729_35785 [Sandaracinaceae bacterium]|nr:hypothetical protein [Sandaracinaceae bacterium]
MNGTPKVHRLVLFKHGVAYVERSGPVDGAFQLSFKREEMNDVLKSLAVWVADGDAEVGAVAFEAPEDPEQVLAERGLALGAGGALHQLVHALRGRRVELDDGVTRRAGEIVGYQGAQGRGERAIGDRAVLRTDRGTLELVELDTLRTLSLPDERSQADLALLVDKSREATARERRTIRVALEGAATDLRCAYIVPAPMWRVSYRLVVEGEDAVVMAWAIVHNPVDEALEGVALTLTTGQPISFVIDLYQPKHVARAVVEETSRAGAPPRPIERAAKAKAMAYGGAPPLPAAFAAPAAARLSVGGLAEGLLGASDDMAAASETGERSEHFEYRVRAPLAIGRGGSAMVPLTASKVAARRERLWSEARGAHPDVVLRFDNATGVVLEEGPAVVYDDGGYAGEAMVPYSARGVEVRLAFARDLAVRCRDERRLEHALHALRFDSMGCVESTEHSIFHRLIAESDHDVAVSVVLELPRVSTHELAPGGAAPTETSASTWRFAVEVPPRGAVTLEVEERYKSSAFVALPAIESHQVRTWLLASFVSDALSAGLEEVLAAWARRDARHAERAAEEARLRAVYEAQESLQKQLAVLQAGGEEGALRARYARELAANQDRAVELGASIEALGRAADEAEREARRLLSSLGG